MWYVNYYTHVNVPEDGLHGTFGDIFHDAHVYNALQT